MGWNSEWAKSEVVKRESGNLFKTKNETKG